MRQFRDVTQPLPPGAVPDVTVTVDRLDLREQAYRTAWQKIRRHLLGMIRALDELWGIDEPRR